MQRLYVPSLCLTPSRGVYTESPARSGGSRTCPALTHSHQLWVPCCLLQCGQWFRDTSPMSALLLALQPTALVLPLLLPARSFQVLGHPACFLHPPFLPTPSPCPQTSRAGRGTSPGPMSWSAGCSAALRSQLHWLNVYVNAHWH